VLSFFCQVHTYVNSLPLFFDVSLSLISVCLHLDPFLRLNFFTCPTNVSSRNKHLHAHGQEEAGIIYMTQFTSLQELFIIY